MTQPEIRFNGFSDEWDIFKLKDVVIESIEKSATEDQYDVLSSTVNGIELRKGRVSGKSNIGYKVLDLNHLVLSPQNLWLGNINVNRFIKGIVSPSYKVYEFNSDRLDSTYASYMLRTSCLLKEYKDVSVQGASTVRRSLDLNRFYDIKCELPTLPEQQKIGALFSKYDAIISLYEQKLEELNALKKGMLQQMFDDGVATSHKPQATSKI